MSNESIEEAVLGAIASTSHFPEVMEKFNSFWRDLVCDEQGNLDLLKVAAELYDYSVVLDQVPRVYMDITNGKLSKPHYEASVVIAAATDAVNDLWDEVLKDEKKQWAADLIDSLVGTRFDEANLFDIINKFTKETE